MKTSRTLVALAALASAAAVPLVTPVTSAAAADDLRAAKAASARYHSVTQAIRDGYTGEHEPCVASPAGTMGIHYVNQALIQDGVVDPARPEILLYVPGKGGRLELVGVEYFAVDGDQDLATDGDRPTVLGQPFEGPMEPHGPGMPIHYDLHVWLWTDNPAGTFAPFNPALSC